jgi:hypothetical protein
MGSTALLSAVSWEVTHTETIEVFTCPAVLQTAGNSYNRVASTIEHQPSHQRASLSHCAAIHEPRCSSSGQQPRCLRTIGPEVGVPGQKLVGRSLPLLNTEQKEGPQDGDEWQ